VLNGRITLLRSHATLQTTNVESRTLKTECNQVQEGDKLGEDERLDGAVLAAQSLKLLDKSLELRRRLPVLRSALSGDT
jgi:hypothetical protein